MEGGERREEKKGEEERAEVSGGRKEEGMNLCLAMEAGKSKTSRELPYHPMGKDGIKRLGSELLFRVFVP